MAGFRRFGSWLKKSFCQKSRREKHKEKLEKQPEKKDEVVSVATPLSPKLSENEMVQVSNGEDLRGIDDDFPTFVKKASPILDAIIKKNFRIQTITYERALEEQLINVENKHFRFKQVSLPEWEQYCEKYKEKFEEEILKHFPSVLLRSSNWSWNTAEFHYWHFIDKLKSQQLYYNFWKKDLLDINKDLDTIDTGGLLNIACEEINDKFESLQTSAEKLEVSEFLPATELTVGDECEFLETVKKTSESNSELLQKPLGSSLTAEAVRCTMKKAFRLLDDAHERDFSPTTFEKIRKTEMQGAKIKLPGTEEWEEYWTDYETRIAAEISEHFSTEWEWEKVLCSIIQKQYIEDFIKQQDRQSRDYIFWKELEKRKNSNLENPKFAVGGEALPTNVKI